MSATVRPWQGMGVVLSAGTLLYRVTEAGLEVLIAHMGGPFWSRKDEHAWSIPKGEYDAGEEPAAAAAREFAEEMGSPVPPGELVALGEFRVSGAKRLTVFTLCADFDVTAVRSNTFELEWPPRSGRMQAFPEIDRAEWVDTPTARVKLVKGQLPVLDALVAYVDAQSSPNQ